jgi:hypothetical protein
MSTANLDIVRSIVPIHLQAWSGIVREIVSLQSRNKTCVLSVSTIAIIIISTARISQPRVQHTLISPTAAFAASAPNVAPNPHIMAFTA